MLVTIAVVCYCVYVLIVLGCVFGDVIMMLGLLLVCRLMIVVLYCLVLWVMSLRLPVGWLM